jgi:hypothetical protein
MKMHHKFSVILMPVLILVGMLFLFGCSEDTPVDPALTGTQSSSGGDPFILAEEKGIEIETQDGSITPAELVTVDIFGTSFTFWQPHLHRARRSRADQGRAAGPGW